MTNRNSLPRYREWLLFGSGGKPGWQRFTDIWLLVHIAIGGLLAQSIQLSLSDAARAILLPLVGVLVGLTFAWAGNASSLLQSKEIGELSRYKKGGFAEYVFVYQTAILVILSTVAFWGLAGLGLFDDVWPTPSKSSEYMVVKLMLYAMISLTIRECWHAVLGAQWMLLIQRAMRDMKKKQEDN